eukprot:6487569-Amphidinium_carterae.1
MTGREAQWSRLKRGLHPNARVKEKIVLWHEVLASPLDERAALQQDVSRALVNVQMQVASMRNQRRLEVANGSDEIDFLDAEVCDEWRNCAVNDRDENCDDQTNRRRILLRLQYRLPWEM